MPKCDFATESFITDLLKSEFSEDVYEGRWKVKVQEVKSEETPFDGICLAIPENSIMVKANIRGNNLLAAAKLDDLSTQGLLQKTSKVFRVFTKYLLSLPLKDK